MAVRSTAAQLNGRRALIFFFSLSSLITPSPLDTFPPYIVPSTIAAAGTDTNWKLNLARDQLDWNQE